ncbi:MAG: glycosyltransferase [Nitrospira sp.]|nr:glycosyltransferase [Nitrospira sp.]TKB89161.1 MAG: glycosyltransferase [Nitrospira sp.]
MLIMLYSHDSYGLGHIRRSLEIATHLSESIPDASLIMLTGSMQAHAYALPERMEYIKLPALTKDSGGQYCSRLLPHTIDITLKLRQRIILESVRNLRPDILLVDKAPAGIRGELLPALQFLKTKSPSTRIVLGMRDIEDHPDHVHAEWAKSGTLPLLKNTYHAIFLYGSRAIYDPVEEYGLSHSIGKKIVSCGYVGRHQPKLSRERIREQLQLQTDRLVLVTPGGGDDGYSLLKTYIAMLRKQFGGRRPTFDTFLVTGPLMDPRKRLRLQQAANTELALTVTDFTPRLYEYLTAADLVVSMGGYNTIVEILAANQRGIIVPRVHPRLEQCIRAERLAAKGLLEMIHPTKLTSTRLFHAIMQSLQRPRPPRSEDIGIPLDGAANVSKAMKQLFVDVQDIRTNHPLIPRPSNVHTLPRLRAESLPI